MTKKLLFLSLFFIILLAACTTETPVPVPPTATNLPQEMQPSVYPEPVDTAVPLEPTAYPEPSGDAVRPGGRPAAPSAPTAYPYPEPQDATAVPVDAQELVRSMADQVVSAFQARELEQVALMVNPSEGLRFSPYSYVRQEDVRLRVVELPDMLEEPDVYEWGTFEGSGEPISMNFADYFARFVYDVDFAAAPQVSINQRLGMGSTIDNAAEFYPGSIIVEYYFPGFEEQYQGMDWRSLRLVFMDYRGRWVLSGVIHDEWTP